MPGGGRRRIGRVRQQVHEMTRWLSRLRTAPAGQFPSPPRTAAPQTAGFVLGRRPALDGLRGVAVLTVMAGHFLVGRTPGGFIGVDFFSFSAAFLSRPCCCRNSRRTTPFPSAASTSAAPCAGARSPDAACGRLDRRPVSSLERSGMDCERAPQGFPQHSSLLLQLAHVLHAGRAAQPGSAPFGRWRWKSSSTYSGRCC